MVSKDSRVRLWARIAGKEDGSIAATVAVDPVAVLLSVEDHLWWLFNCRQGDAEACPTYGLPDMSDVVAGLPEKTSEKFRQIMEMAIREHEPRISTVRVYLASNKESRQLRAHFIAEVLLPQGEAKQLYRVSASVDWSSNFFVDRS